MQSVKHLIKVEGIRLKAFHGCMEEEAKIGGNYEVNIRIKTEFGKSTETDELTDTVDYCVVNQIVEEEMAIRSKLIEHVAQRIFNKTMKHYPEIHELSIEIVKLSPPIDGDVKHVAVVIQG